MRNRKLQLFIICIFVLTLCIGLFSACGDSKKGNKKTSNKSDESSEETPEETEPKKSSKVYDTGSMKVSVPKGWTALPMTDVFAEEEGALDPFSLQIVKGGNSEEDIFTKPYLHIRYYDPSTYGVAPDRDFYEDVKDIEPIQLENHTYTGFSCTSFGYEMTILWMEEGDHQFQVTVYTNQQDGKLSVTDEDVQEMLNSLSPSVSTPSDDPADDPADDPNSPNTEVSTSAAYWEGYWYGWWCVKETSGKYTPLEGYGWDMYGQIVDYGGSGYIDLWDTAVSYSTPVFNGYIRFENDHLIMDSGLMFGYNQWIQAFGDMDSMDLPDGYWDIDPYDSTVSHFDHMVEITGSYTDSDSEGFRYYIYLKPWGESWDDVRYGDTSGCLTSDMMPLYYDDWYLPLLDLGYQEPPDSFQEGVDILESN